MRKTSNRIAHSNLQPGQTKNFPASTLHHYTKNPPQCLIARQSLPSGLDPLRITSSGMLRMTPSIIAHTPATSRPVRSGGFTTPPPQLRVVCTRVRCHGVGVGVGVSRRRVLVLVVVVVVVVYLDNGTWRYYLDHGNRFVVRGLGGVVHPDNGGTDRDRRARAGAGAGTGLACGGGGCDGSKCFTSLLSVNPLDARRTWHCHGMGGLLIIQMAVGYELRVGRLRDDRVVSMGTTLAGECGCGMGIVVGVSHPLCPGRGCRGVVCCSSLRLQPAIMRPFLYIDHSRGHVAMSLPEFLGGLSQHDNFATHHDPSSRPQGHHRPEQGLVPPDTQPGCCPHPRTPHHPMSQAFGKPKLRNVVGDAESTTTKCVLLKTEIGPEGKSHSPRASAQCPMLPALNNNFNQAAALGTPIADLEPLSKESKEFIEKEGLGIVSQTIELEYEYWTA
ncbi:hypothetical protein BC938DRAFT_477485, partial [Jimgerdemannia flammicorona]